MNAIPLINNAPRPNINVGSIGSPAFNPVAASAKLGGSIGGNVMRQNPASMPVNNETQLRQEVNTSIVALKREAFSLENLIAQAAQTLQDINKRLSELEGKQGDYVKKADASVSSVGGDGKYISAISETDGVISATATDLGNMVPVNSVTSGNMHSVTSGAVYNKIYGVRLTTENLNNITDSGMYYMNNATCANAPSSAYEVGTLNGILFVNQYGVNTPYPNTYTQTIKVFRAGVPYIATRRKWNGGSWGDWYQETTVKYKVITATTNDYGEVASTIIDLDYTKNMIIGINCSWDGTATFTYRDYKPVCNLGNKKYYVIVYNGSGTLIKNESVTIRIAYIEI